MTTAKSRICGVVLLHNPTAAHLSNMESYRHGVEWLYVIDNSPRLDPDRLRYIGALEKTTLLSSGENLGIGAALNRAVSTARAEGYRWMLTMDQDSIFEERQFERFIESLGGIAAERAAIVSPLHGDRDFLPSERVRYDAVSDVSTSGNLLNLVVAEAVGPFNEALFIDSVDHDFCVRARIKGYEILRTKNIYLNHRPGSEYAGSILNLKKKTFYIHSPERMYFIVRNALYMRRTYRGVYPAYTRTYVKRIFERASKCVRYTDRRRAYLGYMLKGVFDHLLG
ncbi:MAG TPA: glycosyltransferase, partial [Desulfobulbaceae bacterium]|nr:glycosyltransferase [Desulfobulbaceae bacterium]